MMAKSPFFTPFVLISVLFYIILTAWIYLAYTGSFGFRIQLYYDGSHSQRQNSPKLKWLGMEDITATASTTAATTEPQKNELTSLQPKENTEMNIITLNKQPNLTNKSHSSHVELRNESLKVTWLNHTGLNTSATLANISQSINPEPSEQSELTPIPVMVRKNFNRMPKWDFDDVYLRSNKPFQTVCAESLRKTKQNDFQKAVIPDIQLYLYKNLLNLSEWNRLSHFNNPFGFMEYNYSDIKNTVDLIPKPTAPLLSLPENDTCIRCAVVGTGGILRGSRMGQEIDSHTYVFRMNGAVLKGYEKDVGKKTSVYVHTAYSLLASLVTFNKYGFDNIPNDEGIKYVMIPEGQRDFEWLQGLLTRKKVSNGIFYMRSPWTYYAGQFNESRFYVLHPDFLRYVRNRFMYSKQLEEEYWDIYRPTNGAFTLFLALHVCDTVDAYGFITENYKKFSNYYYEKEKTEVIFFANHDYDLEIKTWKKLHDEKIIRLYQRDEGQQ